MKIERFLGKKQCLKYTLIKLLLSAEDRQLSQSQLLEQLGISYGNLVQVILEINEDSHSANLEQGLKVVQGRRYGQKYYKLEIKNVAVVDHLLLYYLNHSFAFSLIVELLLGHEKPLLEMLEIYHISKSTFRREVSALNEILDFYGLNISLKKQVTLEGNEWAIRLFGGSLFTYSFGSKHWLSELPSLDSIRVYLSFVSSQFLEVPDLKNDISSLYLVAFSFYRMKNKPETAEKMINKYLYFEHSTDFRTYIDEGLTFLEKNYPKVERDTLIIENRICFTVLLLNNTFQTTKIIPYFLYQNPIFQEEPLFKLSFQLITECNELLPRPLSAEENVSLTYQLCLSAYRHFLLKAVYPFNQYFSSFKGRYITDKVSTMVSEFVNRVDLSFSDKQIEMLKSEYSNTLLSRINWLRYRPSLTICVISNQSTIELQDEIEREVPAVDFTINVNSKMTSQVDLIVSDIAELKNVLEEKSSVPIFYWETIDFSNKDYFQQQLFKIEQEKCEW